MFEVTEETEITTADLHEIVKKQGEEINTLKSLLAAKKETEITLNKKEELPEIPKDAVKVDGKEYKFTVARFRLPNRSEIVLADQAALDNALLKEILAIEGQNILKEQV